jgi:hypothetical protein
VAVGTRAVVGVAAKVEVRTPAVVVAVAATGKNASDVMTRDPRGRRPRRVA